MTSTVVYDGELRTTAIHLQSKTQIQTDPPVDNNGRGEMFSPTDLLATSLASCMLTIMGIKARDMQTDIKGIRIDVEKIMKADPRRVGGINLSVYIPDELASLNDKNKTVLKNAALTCPVAKSIHPEIEVTINWGSWN